MTVRDFFNNCQRSESLVELDDETAATETETFRYQGIFRRKLPSANDNYAREHNLSTHSTALFTHTLSLLRER